VAIVGRLQDKVSIITGAAQGIGAEFARAFAAEGANVVIADISSTDSIVAEIGDAGGEAIGIKADITNSESLQEMVAATEDAFGPVNILVNNAAVFASLDLKPFDQLTEDEWDLMLKVNVRGLWQTSKAVLPSMRKAGGGKIINISSGTVHKGPPGQLHYVASKSAVLGMSRSMARELGGDNIQVNTISPSLTMSEGVLANPAWEPFKKNLAETRIIQRDMLPTDLVGTALFLASSDSDFLTGQSVNVDGGVQLT
jgi:NAD(P)-dependent dehydrogenase (short-subunit alcohol dehydrogenase family)